MLAKTISIFSYNDYRKFLADWYQASKQTRASVSFRTFSKKAGFKSTNIFKLVMEGSRNLTEESIVRFAVGLSLNKEETEFFRNLVYMNQAQTHVEKDGYYKKMVQSRKFNKIKPIEKSQYDFYSTWHHAVIRELICSKDYDGSIEWLEKKIFPKLTVSQIEKSIELLENIGFVKRSGDKYLQQNALLTTGAESTAIALHNYHQSLLSLAKELLPEVPSERRDVSALILGVSENKIPILKKKIQKFREEILKVVAEEDNANEVVTLAIQLFPLTMAGRTL